MIFLMLPIAVVMVSLEKLLRSTSLKLLIPSANPVSLSLIPSGILTPFHFFTVSARLLNGVLIVSIDQPATKAQVKA